MSILGEILAVRAGRPWRLPARRQAPDPRARGRPGAVARRRVVRAALALAVLLALAAPAAATVPPKDCGNLRADGKRYGVSRTS